MLWKVNLKERTIEGQTIRECVGFVQTGDNDSSKIAWNVANDKYYPLEPISVKPIKKSL